MARNEYKKPDLLVYGGAYLISRFIAKVILNAKVTRNDLKNVKGPCVVMAIHTSSLDQCCISLLSHHRMTFVIADALFNTAKGGWIFKRFRTVNKQQFRTDVDDIRNMKNVITHGGKLVIFPAGVFSACGKQTTLPKATGKFLKLMGVDVYVVRFHGLYLSKPKWSTFIRRGGVEVEAFKLISTEDMKKKSEKEMYEIADKGLSFDDYEWQETAQVKYHRGDNIVGLQNILHSCPICKAKKSTAIRDKKTIYCKQCGFEETSDRYCFLHNSKQPELEIRHISDWSRIIRKDISSQLLVEDEYKLEFSGRFFIMDLEKRGFVLKSLGQVKLDKKRIQLIDEKGEVFFDEPSISFPTIPCTPGEYFDMQDGKAIYRIYPDDGMDVMVFVDTVDELYKL